MPAVKLWEKEEEGDEEQSIICQNQSVNAQDDSRKILGRAE